MPATVLIRNRRLKIASAATESEVLDSEVFATVRALTFHAPAAWDGATPPKLQAQRRSDGAWVDVQSPPGTDITLAAGKAVTITSVAFAALRLLAAAAQTVERTIDVELHESEAWIR